MKTTHITSGHGSAFFPINTVALVQRTTVAAVMWPHGAQLLTGWFGGPGFFRAMDYFTTDLSLPYLVGVLVIFIQFFGSAFILAGFVSRASSFAMFVIVTGMIFCGHLDHGFFMNWNGSQQGEGFEYHLLLLGLCASLILTGGGKYSVDHRFRPGNSQE
jgi:putative oxidoreductase